MKENKNTNIIILSSGFTGGSKSNLIKFANSYFRRKNFEVIKMNFSKEEKNFSLLNFNEYNKIIDSELLKLHKNSHLVFIGHSLSASIFINYINSRHVKNATAILWDPSLPEQFKPWFEGCFKPIKRSSNMIDKVNNLILSKVFFNELLTFNSFLQINKIKRKILVITAKNGAVDNGKQMASNCQNITHEIIDKTGHMFGTFQAKKTLLNYSYNFIISNLK